MRFFFLIAIFCAVASGFRFAPSRSFRLTSKFMGESEAPKTEIVPVEKTTVTNAAAFTGGILGFVFGGPAGAVILAGITNYVVKKENDSGEALRGLGKTVIDAYNYINKINGKYDISGKVTSSIASAVSKVETPENLAPVKDTLTTTVSKAKEINEEYNLVSKATEYVGVALTLTDAALEKVEELNAKYDFVESAKKAAAAAVEKAKNLNSQ